MYIISRTKFDMCNNDITQKQITFLEKFAYSKSLKFYNIFKYDFSVIINCRGTKVFSSLLY